jgi:hypothetical protein
VIWHQGPDIIVLRAVIAAWVVLGRSIVGTIGLSPLQTRAADVCAGDRGAPVTGRRFVGGTADPMQAGAIAQWRASCA